MSKLGAQDKFTDREVKPMISGLPGGPGVSVSRGREEKEKAIKDRGLRREKKVCR